LLLAAVSIHHRMVLAGQMASTWLLKSHLFSDNLTWDIFCVFFNYGCIQWCYTKLLLIKEIQNGML
jgi:hypothetical protein